MYFSYIPYICSFLTRKLHGWAPKLSYRFYNIGLNNSYVFFKLIHQLHNPGRRMTTMLEVMKEATHALLQRDVTMQTRDPTHPPSVCDLINAYDTHTRAFWSDSKGGTVSKTQNVPTRESATHLKDRKHALQMQQQKNPWCTHQPSPCISKKFHYCAFEQCPDLKRNNKRKRAYTSTMKCEECSVMNKKICISVWQSLTKRSKTESTSPIQIIKHQP